MQSYQAARQAGEAHIRASAIPATFIRPWYVLGPGHRWPAVLIPAYALLRHIPATRESAERLGLVTLAQIVNALVASVEQGPDGIRVVTVPEIRNGVAAPAGQA
jgi:uncharacterized protein YbjT (DUF2867 family)